MKQNEYIETLVIGKNLIEKYGDIKTSVYIASEFRYQKANGEPMLVEVPKDIYNI